MAGSLAKVALVLANAFIPIAVVLFSSGYFPYKPIIPGEATIVGNGAAPPIFDKVIVMVVDALRR
jgi:ethanolaminephosphotransferase